MAILVTGGTGYIGSHTCVELLEKGFDVVVIDNLINSEASTIDKIQTITGKKIKFIKGDLLDRRFLDKVFSKHKFDAVIHFAGLKAVGESIEKPLLYYHNNIVGTINLLESMKAFNVKKLVFSSSATVYGKGKPPLTEDLPMSTTNPYGATKRMIEEILRDVCAADKDFTAVILRYFNPVGAHKSGLIFENPKGIPNNIAPYIVKVARGELECLGVFGSDYKTLDGTGVRDYIHVVDLAQGHITALEKVKTQGAHIYNLGTGSGVSVLQLHAAFEKAFNKKIPYKIMPRRAGDIDVCYADCTKAKKELGWVAKLGIDDMCESCAKVKH